MLSSARRASLQAQVCAGPGSRTLRAPDCTPQPTPGARPNLPGAAPDVGAEGLTRWRAGQECDDSLSIASTHVEDDASQTYAPAGRSPCLCPASRRRCDFDCEMSHMDAARTCGATGRWRGSNHVSLNGLGIKPKSPTGGAQPSLPERLTGKMSLGERSLAKLTEAFPETRMWGGARGAVSQGGGNSSLCHLADRLAAHGEDVAWHDHEAMRAKYGGSISASTEASTSAPISRHSGFPAQGRKKKVVFANIEKVAKIGKGNSSVVWQCRDVASREPLAMKEVTVDRDENRTSMALRELVTMYGVDHVRVVTCHNVFYANNCFYLVMELMDGGSLLEGMRRWCSLDGTYAMAPAALAKLAHDMLCALHFLHEQLQVVHRDVKPGNILLNCQGEGKLADLGIVTQPGEVQVDPQALSDPVSECTTPATPAIEWIGTVTYMSPERLTGDAYSFSADIWSLGILLVEAAIGRYPLAQLAPGCSSRSSATASSTASSTTPSSKLEFWDLLDLVCNGDCASKLLDSAGCTRADWAWLPAMASSCLLKDHTQRPRASQLLDASSDDLFLRLAQGSGKGALAEWVRESLARASRAQSRSQLNQLPAHLPPLPPSSNPSLHDPVLVEEEGTEEDGWL